MIDKLNKNISILNENPIISKNFAKMILDRKNNAKKTTNISTKKKHNNFKRKKAFIKKKGKNFKGKFFRRFKRVKRPMLFMKKIQFFNNILKFEHNKNRNLLQNNSILDKKRTTFIKLLKNIINNNDNLIINSDKDFENNAIVNNFLTKKANIKTTLTRKKLSKRALVVKWTKKAKKSAIASVQDTKINTLTKKEKRIKNCPLKIKRIKRWQKQNKKKLLYRKRFVTKRSRAFLIPSSRNIFEHRLNINIKPNNIFCNLSDIKNNISTTNSCSAGKYKTKASKKTMRYIFESIINQFYLKIRTNFSKKVSNKNFVKSNKVSKKNKKPFDIIQKKGGLIINLTTPRRLRKKVLRLLRSKFRKRNVLYNVLEKKIFNGCRAPKKVRKKRRRMRVFK